VCLRGLPGSPVSRISMGVGGTGVLVRKEGVRLEAAFA
jgi:hypothetical protein